MTSFVLPKGTVVKLGTISTCLYPYFRQGIPATLPRAGLQLVGEVQAQGDGLYIGELMAYFSACAAFAQQTSEVHHHNQEVLGRFVEALHEAPGVDRKSVV